MIVRSGILNSFKCFKETLIKKNEEYSKCLKPRKAKSNSNLSTDFNAAQILYSSQASTTAAASLSWTVDEHKSYLLILVRQWCFNNKQYFNLNELDLKEGVDFVFIFSNNNNDLQGSVSCKCGTRINLGKNGTTFQLSNFYKHLKEFKCSNMNTVKKNNEKQLALSQTSSLEPNLSTFESTTDPILTNSITAQTSSSSSNTSKKRKYEHQSFQKQVSC